jgi:hypothetical protein
MNFDVITNDVSEDMQKQINMQTSRVSFSSPGPLT